MKIRFILVGCILVAAVIALTAFSVQDQKFAAVNLSKIARDSKLGIRLGEEIDTLGNTLQQLMIFINGNRVMTREQSIQLRALWLETNPTQEQTDELEALKTAIQTASSEYRTLISILEHTKEQIDRLKVLGALFQITESLLPELDAKYTADLREKTAESQQELITKVQAAVDKVGKRDGYTMIFDSGVAPYAANDVTDEVLKVMDEDNP